MDILIYTATALSVLANILLVLLVKTYLPSYIKEKGKNKANKEDLKELTDTVEKIKTQNQLDVERGKSKIQDNAIKQEKKRAVYEDVINGIRIFVQGHESNQDVKRDFYKAYAKAWLWASDDVLEALNLLLDDAVSCANAPNYKDNKGKELYESLILAMRQDVGLSLESSPKYRFFQFK